MKELSKKVSTTLASIPIAIFAAAVTKLDEAVKKAF